MAFYLAFVNAVTWELNIDRCMLLGEKRSVGIVDVGLIRKQVESVVAIDRPWIETTVRVAG